MGAIDTTQDITLNYTDIEWKIKLSPLGVFQLSQARTVTDPNDRQTLSEFLAVKLGGPLQQSTAMAPHRLQAALVKLGMSFAGARQVALGKIVTSDSDRQQLSQVVAQNASRNNEVIRCTF